MTQQPLPSFKDLEKIMRELVLPFVSIERSVPMPSAGGYRNENNAEHSWTLALVAAMLAPRVDTSLNVGRICELAAVHDLVEVYAGDTGLYSSAEDFGTQAEREAGALERLARDFADFPWIVRALQEYEHQESAEASFIRAVDGVLPILHDYMSNGEYYRKNGSTKEDFVRLRDRSRKKASLYPAILSLHEEAVAELLSRPEFFHQDETKNKDQTR